MKNEKKEIDKMLEGIKLSPGILRDCVGAFRRAAEEHADLFGERRAVYMVGCGDALYAAAAMERTFSAFAGVDARAVEAHEFCCYEIERAPKNALVLALSSSGNTARVVECACLAARRGLDVLALTGGGESRLAEACARRIVYSVPKIIGVPTNSAFIGLMLLLYVLGVCAGEKNGRLTATEAARRLAALSATADAMDAVIAESDGPFARLAGRTKAQDAVCFISCGPNLAIARFAALKLIKASAADATAQQTEEFAHVGYFTARAHPEREYILLAPDGAGVRRAREIARELRFLGARTTVVTTRGAGAFGADTEIVLPAVEEALSPFLMAVAVCLYAYHHGRLNGGEGIRFQSPEALREHFETVHYSRFGDEVADCDVSVPEN